MKVLSKAERLFLESIDWLKTEYKDYDSFIFIEERDVVWTLQKHLIRAIENESLPYKVFNGCAIREMEIPGYKMDPRSDMLIFSDDKIKNEKLAPPLDIIVEFKFEPSRDRIGKHFLKSKCPVIEAFARIEKDFILTKEYVIQHKADVAYSVIIDEDGRHRNSEKLRNEKWETWGNQKNIFILIKRYPQKPND